MAGRPYSLKVGLTRSGTPLFMIFAKPLYLDPARSLQFAAARSNPGEGGKTEVKSIMTTLNETGAPHVYGLVDKDNDTLPLPERVFENETVKEIENLLLHPLLLAMYVLHAGDVDEDLPGRYSMPVDNARASHLVSEVQKKFEQGPSSLVFGPPVLTHFMGGISVDVPRNWLQTKKTVLLQQIESAFPKLKNPAHRQLADCIISRVIRDRPELVPSSLVEVFHKIENAD